MSEDSRRDKTVVVVGAGVAGLSTAYLIRRFAAERGLKLNLVVLEKKAQAGGSTRTDLADGYTCEWGPNGFLDNEPKTLDLVRMLGLENDMQSANEAASKRFIYHHSSMRLVPMKPTQFLASNILPLPAKLRIAMEFFIPDSKHKGDETVLSFGRRRLGRSFVKYLLDPMVSGVFAGNAGELSLKAVFPKMVEMEREHGGLFRAQMAKRRAAKSNGSPAGGPTGPSGTLKSFRKGMGQLTETLANRIEGDLLKDVEVRSLQRNSKRFEVGSEGKKWMADAVVLALPSYAASDVIDELAPDAAGAIRAIPYAPVEVVCHGHTADQLGKPLDGFGVLIPRSERIRSLGTLWSDSIFPGQAPIGHRQLRTMLGGAHDPAITDLDEEQIHLTANSDHRRVLNVKGLPVFRRWYHHPRGIAQYTVGHLGRIAKVDELQRELPGLFFTGASYRGVSVNGVVKDAFSIAGELLNILGESG